MSKTIHEKKRNDFEIALLSLLSPILVIFFIAVTFIGESRQPKAKQPQRQIKNTPAEQDGIEFSVIPQEEELILLK